MDLSYIIGAGLYLLGVCAGFAADRQLSKFLFSVSFLISIGFLFFNLVMFSPGAGMLGLVWPAVALIGIPAYGIVGGTVARFFSKKENLLLTIVAIIAPAFSLVYPISIRPIINESRVDRFLTENAFVPIEIANKTINIPLNPAVTTNVYHAIAPDLERNLFSVASKMDKKPIPVQSITFASETPSALMSARAWCKKQESRKNLVYCDFNLPDNSFTVSENVNRYLSAQSNRHRLYSAVSPIKEIEGYHVIEESFRTDPDGELVLSSFRLRHNSVSKDLDDFTLTADQKNHPAYIWCSRGNTGIFGCDMSYFLSDSLIVSKQKVLGKDEIEVIKKLDEMKDKTSEYWTEILKL